MNPTDKWCWQTCPVCYKCTNRKRLSCTDCGTCSGRNDPNARFVFDPDVYCDCKNGILRHETQTGRLIVRKFPSNPFENKTVEDIESQDERDWNHYVQTMRNLYNDPYWDPVKFSDGTSTYDWTQNQRGN